MTDYIKVVIGEKEYRVAKQTLTEGRAAGSWFSAIVSERWNMKSEVRTTGAFFTSLKIEPKELFADRDPEAFEFILRFLRGYDLEIPQDECLYLRIKKDAEFYNLDSLIKALKDYEEKAEKDKELEFIKDCIDNQIPQEDCYDRKYWIARIKRQTLEVNETGTWLGRYENLPSEEEFSKTEWYSEETLRIWKILQEVKKHKKNAENIHQAIGIVKLSVSTINSFIIVVVKILNRFFGYDIPIPGTFEDIQHHELTSYTQYLVKCIETERFPVQFSVACFKNALSHLWKIPKFGPLADLFSPSTGVANQQSGTDSDAPDDISLLNAINGQHRYDHSNV
jgi:hypothetical protein